jgi:type I restriction enzyme, R subunit
MPNITENATEVFAIQLFEKLGYSRVYAPDIAPDSEYPERSRYDEVLLTQRLNIAVRPTRPSPWQPSKQPSKKWSVSIRPNCSPIMKPFTACSRKA